MAPGHEHETHLLGLARAVEGGHGRVLDREEVAFALVDVVRQAAAEALAREGQLALDPVAIGLEEDR